jgi:hypothetical protein
MPFQSREVDPAEVKVAMPVRVPLRYRDQLVAAAHERGISLNELLVSAITTIEPPQ